MSTGYEPNRVDLQMIEITPNLAIPEDELTFSAARSGGPGGQHVNKTSTRVTLTFDVAGSPSLSDGQKSLILTRLAGRVNKQGELKVSCGATRSQAANRQAATARFVSLIRQALERRAPRKKTRVPRAARKRRLEAKRRRGEVKKKRAAPSPDENA